MNSPMKINPRDFEYLTTSDKEYLYTIERLYLLNSGKLKHFHILGPWHQVKSRKLNEIVERVAGPYPRPCTKGHVKGLWCVQDPDYITGPKILKYSASHSHSGFTSLTASGQTTGTSTPARPSSSTQERFTIRPPTTPKNKYSIPRKYQIVPKPTPWIIMEPSKKKNFICDDPPDPSYNLRETKSAGAGNPRSAGRKSTGRSRYSHPPARPSTCADSRYVASPYTTSVTTGELGQIIERVTKPTHASKGGVDLQEKYKNKDYVYGSQNCKPDIEHIAKPTISSTGGKDIADKYDSKGHVIGSKNVSPDTLDTIVTRVTRPTVASAGGAGSERKYTDFTFGEQKVSKDEMSDIIDRITKPTVSSRGGIDYMDREFKYITPTKKKTNIIIPGLDKKFIGRKKISTEQMQEIIERLTKLTPAYKAKFRPNPHVWKDESTRTGPAHQRDSISTI